MKDLARHLVSAKRVPVSTPKPPPPPNTQRVDSWKPEVQPVVVPEPEVVLSGRRRGPASRTRSEQVNVYLTPDERKRLLAAMKRRRLKTISDTIREILLAAFDADADAVRARRA
jgi:hypothetical protein